MANPTLFQLATTTVGSGGVSSVTFSAIPQVYTDLKILISAKSDYASAHMNMTVAYNSITSGYSYINLNGDGSSASSGSNIVGTSHYYIGEMTGTSGTANSFTNGEIYIPNYTSANYKSASVDMVNESNNAVAYAYASLDAALVSNTASITSITIAPGAGNFVQYSTFTLYGVRNY